MSDLRVLVEDEEFGEDFYVHTTIGAVFTALREAGVTVQQLPPVWCVEHQGIRRFGELWVCPEAEQNEGAGRFCRMLEIGDE